MKKANETINKKEYFEILSGLISESSKRHPSEVKSEVRIFLSSTFRDFELERNYIIENVYNSLREYCLMRFDIQFIIIDLRWGINDEAVNQQLTSEICLEEIKNCQKYSIGPSFAVLLGDIYGSKFLKPLIEEEEFKLIENEAKKLEFKKKKNVLNSCYNLDNNDLNKKYYKLKNMDEIKSTLECSNEEWKDLENKLVENLRNTVEDLYNKKKLEKKQRDIYFTSITEQEVNQCLSHSNSSNIEDQCVAFIRKIDTDPKPFNKNAEITKFIETDKVGIDRLNQLKQNIKSKLTENKTLFQLNVDWKKVNSFQDPHAEFVRGYLKQFGDIFRSSITSIITTNMEAFAKQEKSGLDLEILHQHIFCKNLLGNMNDRKKEIDKIIEYLNSNTNDKPFIIYGKPGCGKTTILAYAIKSLRYQNDVFIYRFLGTSRQSSNIKSVIRSIMQQIITIYALDGYNNIFNVNETTVDMKNQLENLLFNVSTKINTKLVIILDSIDQLSKYDYELDWFISELPKKVKIIYSVIPKYAGLLDKMYDKIAYNQTNYLEIGTVDSNFARKMLENLLKHDGRKLTGSTTETFTRSGKQWAYVNQLINQPMYVLHVKIIFHIVKKWPSYYLDKKDFLSCKSTVDTIKYLFKSIEKLHGKTLFSRCIFYLTLFEYNGIAESELEDILSIDDDVLTSVFEYHHPPVRRFQISLWIKIKHELRNYITYKETDDVPVISWFHRCFIEASKEYYKDMFTESELRDNIIMNVIDYFIEKWNKIRADRRAGEQKSFVYKKKQLKSFEKKEDKYLAYRDTKPQGISRIKDNKTMYNKRKLNELLNLIYMLRNTEEKVDLLKKHVFFNYEFMQAKFEQRELDFLFKIPEELFRLNNVPPLNNEKLAELKEIVKIYSKTYPLIVENPHLLYYETMNRLSSRSSYAESFEISCGLRMITPAFKVDDPIRSLHIKKIRINRIYSQFEGPLLFIEAVNSSNKNELEIIDSNTSKQIGIIDFKNKAPQIQIFIINSRNDIKNLSELSGRIYFTDDKTICSTNFQKGPKNFKKMKEKIERILLLNSKFLIILTSNHISLFNINDNKTIENLSVDSDSTKILKSTIPEEIVFTSEYLDSVYSITIILAEWSIKDINLIKIYQFKKDSMSLVHEINSVKWSTFGLGKWTDSYDTWRESLIIEDSFFITKTKSIRDDHILIRFAIQEKREENNPINNNNCIKTLQKIIEITNEPYQECVTEITEDEFKISELEKYKYLSADQNTNELISQIELDAFVNGYLIMKLRSSSSNWIIYLYNLENKNVFSHQIQDVHRIHFFREKLSQTDYNFFLFMGQIAERSNELSFYKICDKEINEINRVDVLNIDYKDARSNTIMKNNKLLRIEPAQRLVIEEIDFTIKNQPKKQSKSLIRIRNDGLLCVLDNKHILAVVLKDDGRNDIASINVKKLSIDETLPYDNCELISFNREYVVFMDKNGNLTIYFIRKNEKDSFQFLKMFEKKIEEFNEFSCKCWFDKFNSNKLIITLYNKHKACVDITLLEVENEKINAKGQMKAKVLNNKTYKLNLQNRKINLDLMQYFVDSLNQYFVLFESTSGFVYYLKFEDTENYSLEIINEKISNGFSLPNSNNSIFQCSNSIYYIYFDINQKTLCKKKLKDYENDNVLKLKIEDNYLFVFTKYPKMEMYKISDIISKGEFDDKPITFEESINDVRVSITGELSSLTKVTYEQNQLCFYEIKETKLLATLSIKSQILYFLISDEYMSLKLHDIEYLLVFKKNIMKSS